MASDRMIEQRNRDAAMRARTRGFVKRPVGLDGFKHVSGRAATFMAEDGTRYLIAPNGVRRRMKP